VHVLSTLLPSPWHGQGSIRGSRMKKERCGAHGG
jgi:hypothetical protein